MTVSRPDICARLAQLASRVNDLQGSNIYRINALIKTAKTEQPRAVLKYASSSSPRFPASLDPRGRLRGNGERVRSSTLSLVGWSDAAYGDRLQNGRCCLGYLSGITTSFLFCSGPCHYLVLLVLLLALLVLQWTLLSGIMPLPCSAVDLQVHTQTCQEQLGGGSLRVQRDGRPYGAFERILRPLFSYLSGLGWDGRL